MPGNGSSLLGNEVESRGAGMRGGGEGGEGRIEGKEMQGDKGE